jgi:GINS complex subunit 4
LQVLELLENAWLNEKSSPDILPYQGEVVDLMFGQIAHMEENLENVNNKNDFRYLTHKMELERIKYIAINYLACRLQKIEEFTQHVINEEDARSENDKRLSEKELQFAKGYFDSVEQHFQTLILRHIPPSQDDEKRLVRPNPLANVFVKVLKSCGVVVNTNDEEIDLTEGSLHMLPFQLVSDLVIKGDIQLV